ncbi:hypothetical protein P4129_08640 [Pseudomonas aeruginosa]|nr:hypothetical protein [Pseudomonas aeruginosa]
MHSNESTEDRCSRHYTLLQRCPLLHGLPDLLRHVATHASERRLRDKDVLFLSTTLKTSSAWSSADTSIPCSTGRTGGS